MGAGGTRTSKISKKAGVCNRPAADGIAKLRADGCDVLVYA